MRSEFLVLNHNPLIKQLQLLVLLLIVFVLIGCSRVTDPLSELAGQNNNRITVYSPFPADRIDDYLDGFNTIYPDIEVNLEFGTAAVLTEKLAAAEPNNRPDVIWGMPVANALQLEWLDLLKPYEPDRLERIDKRFYDTNNPPHWVGTAARVLVFCVNTEKSAELELPIPRTWQDLLDPIYQGHITTPSPTTSGSGFLVLGTIFDLFGENDSWEYLELFHKQVDEYAVDVKVACELAAAGDVPIAISFDYRTVQRQEAGDPIEIIYPTDGAGWDMEVTGLVRKEDVVDAAKIFIDWATSDAALELYGEDREILAVDANFNSDRNDPADYALNSVHELLLDEDIPRISANRKRILREWTERFADGIVILTK